jgi:hypothetical protein
MPKIIKNSDDVELMKVKFPPKRQLSADKGWFSSLSLDPKTNIPQHKIIHITKLYTKQLVVSSYTSVIAIPCRYGSRKFIMVFVFK